MAEGARDADAGEVTGVIDFAPNSDNRVQPYQFDGHSEVGEIDLASAKRGDDRSRQGLDIDLEAHG
jgi:hypothetical protein